MKKILFLILVSGQLLSACLPASLQPDAVGPTPVLEADLEATAALLSQQTLQALPTPTLPPSNTPVITTPTVSATGQELPTETQSSALLTITATLNTFLVSSTGTPITQTTSITGSPSTPSNTPNPLISATLTGTAHPQHYGTMPPYLPFGHITLINKSKTEVYISLQCTTKDGYVSIIETPVVGTAEIKAPAGKYIYVAWVGGRKIIGKFGLDSNTDIKIKIFKDHLEIGS